MKEDTRSTNIFIIGSISQMEDIKFCNDYFTLNGFNVKHVKPEPEKCKEQLIRDAFDMIDKADFIMVVYKPDNTLGDGTAYEKEYAYRVGKNIINIDNEYKAKMIKKMEEMKR